MVQEVIIIGAGGQAKNTSLVIEQIGSWNILGFVDDCPEKKGTTIRGYPVLGSLKEICEQYDEANFAFAIGNSAVVQRMVGFIKATGKSFTFPNLIHPAAQIDLSEVEMGEGNIVFPSSLFLSEIKMGNFNFFNFKCAISHEVRIGDYCIVQPGVNILGRTTLKDRAYCGANATIVQGKTIGENSLVGAGTVVTKDVEDNAVMVGNPAKLLRYKE